MKHKIKNYLKLGILLFGVLLMLVGCQKDDNHVINSSEESFKFNVTNFKELNKDIKFNNAYNEFKTSIIPQTNASYRSDLEDLYNFKIDSSLIKEISKDGYTTYTFLIKRTEQDSSYYENLALQVDSQGNTKAYIIKYTKNAEPIYIEDHESYIDDASIELTRVFYSDPDSNTQDPECIHVATWYCNWGGEDHVAGINCTAEYIFLVSELECTGGSTQPGGGTNTGNNSPGGINTAPILGEDGKRKECRKITDLLTNIPTLLNKLQTNKGQTNLLQESGFIVLNSSTTPIDSPVGTDGAVELVFPSTDQLISTSHTHNSPATATYSVPSWQDIVDGLVETVKGNHLDSSQFVGFLFTADGTSFAYTISDINAFNTFWSRPDEPEFDINQALNRVKLMKDYYAVNDPNTQPFIDESSTDNVTDIKHFLDLINDNNMGITLFEESDDFTTFKKLEHNKTTNSIDKEPCN